MICERCKDQEPASLSMSYFNTQMICTFCQDAEAAHPKYQEARAAENRAVRRGNFNFEGIGLPPELEVTDGEEA
jgi:hypothetical protein